MILGLDISTSITGYCIVDTEGEVIRNGAWDLRNKNIYNSEFRKATKIKEELCQLKVQYPIEKIFIEKPFMFFKSGGSSAKTMAILQRFNGVISWITFEIFDKEPIYLTASQARKILNIRITKGQHTKKEVLSWLTENLSNFSVEYTKFGNPKPRYFDIGDATVIALAALKTLHLPNEI